MNHTFKVSQELNLRLSIRDKVYIQKSSEPYLSISNSNNDTEVKAYQEGNTISITQTLKSTPFGESIIINGNRSIKQEVIGDNNFTIGNISGGVINMGTVKGDMIGQTVEHPISEIDIENSNSNSDSTKNALIISVPYRLIPNVKAELSTVGRLITSFIELGHVEIKAKGNSFTNILCKSLVLKAKGNSTTKATIPNGELNIDCKGNSWVSIRGPFSKVTLKAKGSSNIKVIGECKGDHSSSASGMAKVSCYGSIAGEVSQSISGMAEVNYY